jgi:sugar O-acyltransferase (sialic acid O-acetyltransferase NeuD family)
MIESGHPGPLLLMAASGLAREAAESASACGREVLGFLDDDLALADGKMGGWPVLGTIDDVHAYEEAALVVCVGRGVGRERVVKRLHDRGIREDRFSTVVDPSVRVPPSCRVGVGSVLLGGVVLTSGVVLGRHVVVMPNATLTHDDRLDDYATICAGVALGGNVTIGRGVYLGMNASVRERCTVSEWATVGMGAAVVTDVPAGETWAGVPARRFAVPGSANDGG